MTEYKILNKGETEIKSLKAKIEECLIRNNIVESINENMECLLTLIPEIKNIVGFEHKHPHHHLDVWEHTLEVLKNLNSKDLELNMAALLHDIGKPFSYQDEEVRHFHGHPEMSYEMTQQILTRLGYDEEFIKRVAYLVKTHDTVIEPSKLDNSFEMIQKRLQLQYADAKAHHPGKVEKRIKFLDSIKEQLYNFVDIDNILGYDCDGEEIEEFRILRYPFSADIDDWDEVPNVDPRFYCAIKGNNNQSYLISVYDDYNSSAIKKYEKIRNTEQIPVKIKSIDEAINYEVAFDGIERKYWYYDRDRNFLKEELELIIKGKDKKIIDIDKEI